MCEQSHLDFTNKLTVSEVFNELIRLMLHGEGKAAQTGNVSFATESDHRVGSFI